MYETLINRDENIVDLLTRKKDKERLRGDINFTRRIFINVY